MDPEPLPDPSEMSPQERTLSLVEAIGNDDLLGVLLVLYFIKGDEINATALSTTHTPLEAAVVLPTSRPAVRRTIAECILHHDAAMTTALELAHTHRNPEMVALLENWCKGGSERAETARKLVREMDLEEAEAWIRDAGMALEELLAMDSVVEEQIPAPDVFMTEQEERKADSPPLPPRSTRRTHSRASPPSSSSFEPHALSLSVLPLYAAEADVRDLVTRIVGPERVSAVSVVHRRYLGDSTALVVVGSERGRDKAVQLLEGTYVGKRKIIADPAPLPAWAKSSGPTPSSTTPTHRRSRSPPARRRRSASPRRHVIAPYNHHSPSPPSRHHRSPSPPSRHPPPYSCRSRSPVRWPDKHGDPFHSRQRDFLSSSPPPSGPLKWMHVSKLPTTIAERYLYDRLAASCIHTEDIFLERKSDGIGYAFVALRTDSDVSRAVKLFNGLWGFVGARPYRDPWTGQTEPNFVSSTAPTIRRVYKGPRRDSRAPPSPYTRKIVIRHLRPGTTPAQVVSFLERVLGRGGVREVSVREVRSTGVMMAYVTLVQHEDCVRAICDLDGEVCNGRAVSITWFVDPAKTKRSGASLVENAGASLSLSEAVSNGRSPPRMHPRAQPPALTSSNTQPLGAWNRYSTKPLAPSPPRPSNGAADSPPNAPRRSSPPSTSTSCRRDSPPPASTSNHRPSPSPPRRSPSPATAAARAHQAQLELDLSRLSSLDLSPSDVLSIQQLWTPLSSPPVPQPQQASSSTPFHDPNQGAFERPISLTARFGFLPQEEAKRALEGVKRGERAYPEDEAMESGYERFLKAQAGEDRDHYMDFFARLDDFDRSNALFAKKGRQAADASRIAEDQDSLPPRPPAINGLSHSHSPAQN
ncbi:hypothetical protein JCM1840_003716 [Sporobolomyces johnsonii]